MILLAPLMFCLLGCILMMLGMFVLIEVAKGTFYKSLSWLFELLAYVAIGVGALLIVYVWAGIVYTLEFTGGM